MKIGTQFQSRGKMGVYPAGILVLLAAGLTAFASESSDIHVDRPFLQDYSEQVPLAPEVRDAKLLKVRMDRNGRILVLSDKGLLQVCAGTLRPERQYRSLSDGFVKDLEVHDGQFVYMTDTHVLSHAWAGRLLTERRMSGARLLVPGEWPQYLVVAPNAAAFFSGELRVEFWQTGKDSIRSAGFDSQRKRFLLLTDKYLLCAEPGGESRKVFHGDKLTCLAISHDRQELLVGSSDGYFRLDADSFEPHSEVERMLPCTAITCIRPIGDSIWFGTPRGAFRLHPDGRIDYYASKRWLLNDAVVDIWPGEEGSVLVLSESGLSVIHFREMTLAQKAGHFDRLTRSRHVRYGLNSAFVMTTPGDLSTGTLIDTDNDGLWTAMYLAGELFRYAVTRSDDALRNCYEAFEGMERLSEITPMEGFPARSFERAGYEVADKSRWHIAEDKRWAWKGTTSSDEIVGHFFVYAVFAEIAPDEAWRQRAIALIDDIMDHIVRNNWYLVDYDGKPTQWGRWHPEYVNQFPRQVGDRRLNSVEIIAFLQTAYHFTGKEIYRTKAFELLEKQGYLDNIMIPIGQLGRVSGIDLTTEWNHSDDELAFLSYWNLYRYAFSGELRDQYRQTIRDHWEIERPEKNPLWNFICAACGGDECDLEESIWNLRHLPLDMVSWTVQNSRRRDLEFLGPNFREQSTNAVLPPDERPMSKYNGNAFRLDGGDGGRREFSGDIYLLPYWMGRYLGLIR